jgi:hypothetical protein
VLIFNALLQMSIPRVLVSPLKPYAPSMALRSASSATEPLYLVPAGIHVLTSTQANQALVSKNNVPKTLYVKIIKLVLLQNNALTIVVLTVSLVSLTCVLIMLVCHVLNQNYAQVVSTAMKPVAMGFAHQIAPPLLIVTILLKLAIQLKENALISLAVILTSVKMTLSRVGNMVFVLTQFVSRALLIRHL